jgi:hypothetical protein
VFYEEQTGRGICIKAGTTVTWQSTNKNTGFMVDCGEMSPFDPAGTISGGTIGRSRLSRKDGDVSNIRLAHVLPEASTGCTEIPTSS